MADIWSLGVLLFTMVTGKVPWAPASSQVMVRQIMREKVRFPETVSEECRELIEGMLQISPKSRMGMEEIMKHRFLAKREQSVFYRAESAKELEAPRQTAVEMEELLGAIKGFEAPENVEKKEKREWHAIVDARAMTRLGRAGRMRAGGIARPVRALSCP
jgi:serine/threonine protein kinase